MTILLLLKFKRVCKNKFICLSFVFLFKHNELDFGQVAVNKATPPGNHSSNLPVPSPDLGGGLGVGRATPPCKKMKCYRNRKHRSTGGE